MKKARHLSVTVANEIERLVSRYEEVSGLYRARAKDPRVSNRSDLLQIADFLEEKARTLREHSHRFGPAERLELIATANARIEAASLHLSRIKFAKVLQFEQKKEAA